MQAIRVWWRWLNELRQRSDLLLLLSVLTVVVGGWLFFAIADEVTEGDTHSFDVWVIKGLRKADNPNLPIGPAWLHQSAIDITALGGFTVLTMMVATVAGFLILLRKYHAFLLLMVIAAGGFALNTLLKYFYDRPRPNVVPHLTEVNSASFPSGHSMLSAIIYLTLAVLVARLLQRRTLRIYVIAVSLLLVGLIGLTRIYLGVHYPTDVLAGWTAGLVWAAACWLGTRLLQHLGIVEQSLWNNHSVSTEN